MEDITGEPFKGRAGAILDQAVWKHMGLKRGEYSLLNSIKCRPAENREPNTSEKRACKPWLMLQLNALNAEIIITLGAHAAQTILGKRYPMHELRELWFTDSRSGVDIVPTFHPMATAYVKARRQLFESDLATLKLTNGEISKTYREVRRVERCTIPFNEPQSLDGYGVILSP
jgi:DNA polymerase